MQGLRRYRTVWRLFRNWKAEPERFFGTIAEMAVDDLDGRHRLAGSRILDLGSGPGWYSEALARRGAVPVSLDVDVGELSAAAFSLERAVAADAGRVPAPDGTFDGVLTSNMLEHVPHPTAVIDEIARVLRPGAWGYISWTNWYSPYGGHEMAPFHYLGPKHGTRLYERLKGPPPRFRCGENLFPVHIGPTISFVRDHPLLEVTRFEPRYWPWARAIMRLPGVREVLAWNCVIGVRRLADTHLR